MQHHEHDSPLPPDPVGREDIMSDDPREDAVPGAREGSPLPPRDAGREDVLRDEPRDEAGA
ncbi:MAG: hypothetical protein JO037_02110 [Actinobacteria bacterium]|nr:hypothetical protein [Actinomycetota bacterium]